MPLFGVKRFSNFVARFLILSLDLAARMWAGPNVGRKWANFRYIRQPPVTASVAGRGLGERCRLCCSPATRFGFFPVCRLLSGCIYR